MLLLWAGLLISFASQGNSYVKGNSKPKSLRCQALTDGVKFIYYCNDIKINKLCVDTSPVEYTHLYFMNCSIKEVLPGAFHVVRNMVHLDLSHNSISSLENETFVQSIKLQHLDLSYNNLQVLNTSLFEKLERLRELHLSRNKLVALTNAETFVFQSGLQTLDLSENTLKTLKEDVLKPLTSLKKLALQGNSVDCDCEFVRVMDWIINHSLNFSVKCVNKTNNADLSWRDLEYLRCNESHKMKGMIDLAPKSSNETYVYIALSASLIILFFIVVLAIIWWRRRKTTFVQKSETEASIYGSVIKKDYESGKLTNLDHLYAKVNKNPGKKGVQNEGFLGGAEPPSRIRSSTNDSVIYAEVSQPTFENHVSADISVSSGEYACILVK